MSLWSHPSILSFGHKADIYDVAECFPDDIIFGNIEPAKLQVYTPQEVYAVTKIAIEEGRRAEGGFIIGPGCGLPPQAPPVNSYAMTKAVNDSGRYE